MRLTYSAQRSGFDPGKRYANPRYFDGVAMPGITEVEIVGDWPKVRAAYEAAGVRVIGAEATVEVVASAAQPTKTVIAIPPDWRDLPWSRPKVVGDLTLRTVVKSLGETAINRDQAVEAIERHLAEGSDDAGSDQS